MRYHPLYEGFWTEEKLDGAPPDERLFAAYLFSNAHVRPSGIYRVTDQQAAVEVHLPLKRVAAHFVDLTTRRFIVRDHGWVFVVGYFRRQPKQPFLLRGAERDVAECTSLAILQTWSQQYPHLKQWSANRRATIEQRLGNGTLLCSSPSSSPVLVVGGELHEEQSRRASPAPAGPATDAPQQQTASSSTQPPPAFQLPSSLLAALTRAPLLSRVRDPHFWQAEFTAHRGHGLDYAAEVLKAEAWCVANPLKAPRRSLTRFLHGWLQRAATHHQPQGPHA